MSLRTVLSACALTLTTLSSGQAHTKAPAPIDIVDAYAYATAPGQPVGGAYLKIINHGPPDRLLAAQTPVAKITQLHTMSMQGNVMRMREVNAIDLPANQMVELRPGANHLMLTELQAPLQAGQTIALTLQFERTGPIDVQLLIKPRQ